MQRYYWAVPVAGAGAVWVGTIGGIGDVPAGRIVALSRFMVVLMVMLMLPPCTGLLVAAPVGGAIARFMVISSLNDFW